MEKNSEKKNTSESLCSTPRTNIANKLQFNQKNKKLMKEHNVFIIPLHISTVMMAALPQTTLASRLEVATTSHNP